MPPQKERIGNILNTISRIVVLALLVVSMAGCIPGRSVVPQGDGSRFVLREDAIRKYPPRFSYGESMVEGLKRGEYIAVAHDDEGIYYRGPRECYVRLIGELGDQYLATGQRPAPGAVFYRQFGLDGSEGGVYVPHDPKSTPFYFFYMDFRVATGETEARVPTAPDSALNQALATPPAVGSVVSQPPNAEGVRELADVAARGVVPGNSLQAMQVQAAGTTIGIALGKSMGTAAQRNAQGKIMLGGYVMDERLLAALKHLTHAPAPGLAADGSIPESTP